MDRQNRLSSKGELDCHSVADLRILADPLTAIALNMNTCIRLIDAQRPDLKQVGFLLEHSLSQCIKAQSAYYFLQDMASQLEKNPAE